jgi:hypothetical protein
MVKLRQRSLRKVLPFQPSLCTCGTSLLGAKPVRVQPMVLQLQTAMLDAKRYGAIDIEGIGRLSGPEFVALADVLLGTPMDRPKTKGIGTNHPRLLHRTLMESAGGRQSLWQPQRGGWALGLVFPRMALASGAGESTTTGGSLVARPAKSHVSASLPEPG